jgi:small subunit ribosomal protein S2
VIADAVAEGLIARSGVATGADKAEAEPLAAWERELLEGDKKADSEEAAAAPAAEAAAEAPAAEAAEAPAAEVTEVAAEAVETAEAPAAEAEAEQA